jgi:hypothetical protein
MMHRGEIRQSNAMECTQLRIGTIVPERDGAADTQKFSMSGHAEEGNLDA